MKTFSVKSQQGKTNNKKKINQDNYITKMNILNQNEFDIFCVLDGHGKN